MSEHESASVRRLARVRGVRATPGGWVRVTELVDGWASFPDQRATGRRVLWIGSVLLLALLAALIIAERAGASVGVQQALGWPLLFGFVALIVVDEIADDRATALRRRVRQATVRRHWWRTTVEVEFTSGQHLSYRAVGLCAPARLARIFTGPS